MPVGLTALYLITSSTTWASVISTFGLSCVWCGGGGDLGVEEIRIDIQILDFLNLTITHVQVTP